MVQFHVWTLKPHYTLLTPADFAPATTSTSTSPVPFCPLEDVNYVQHPIPLIEDLNHSQYPLPLLGRVHEVDVAGTTAVMRAAASGDVDTVRFLLRAFGADVDDRDMKGLTALWHAADKGHIAVIRCLAREYGAKVNTTDQNGITALMKAAVEGRVDVVRCLARVCWADVNYKNWNGSTALTMAAYEGRTDVVQCLARDCGANVDATDRNGSTALMMAAREGCIDVVRYLAEDCGADVNEKDNGGVSALTEAASQGQIEAASHGHIGVIRFLATKCTANLRATDRHGNTALIMAASNGHLAAVRWIAGQIADAVNTQNGYGSAALTKAVHKKVNGTARSFALKMVIDQANKFGFTALLSAADKGSVDVVRSPAKEFAANVDAPSRDGTTPLMRAVERGHIDIVRCLVGECNADVDATNVHGNTALILAATKGDVDLVRLLAKSFRADVNIRNRKGYNAIQGAANSGNQEVQRLLTSFITVSQTEARAITVVNYASSGGMTEGNWHIPPSEMALLNFVETSNIGGDYQATWLDSDIAVKLFIPDASSFEDEVRLWHQLRHPNVIKMCGDCDANPLPLQFFVCEYATNGSLLEYVQSTCPVQQSVWSVLHRAALGLSYLHERGIVHGDLRFSNILIGTDGLSKLANFTRNDQVGKREISSRAGLIRWQAPEVLKGRGWSFASDIYSLGMCIVEAVTKEMPWKDRCTDRYINVFNAHWTPETKYDNWGPNCPPGDARNLVWRMCCNNLHKRVSLAFVVHELERLAVQESAIAHDPEHESTINYINRACTETQELWMKVQIRMEECDNDLYHQAFDELKTIWEYNYAVEQTSSGSATISNASCQLQYHRVPSTPTVHFDRLGESTDAIAEQDVEWDEQRSKDLHLRSVKDLGTGGYGSMFRAKWLDSDVVVKLLSSSGENDANPILSVSYDSLLQPSATAANPKTRVDMMTVFRREGDIWFGCSHPHVVRLFGACHVGRPLFVCEYASNGTLVSYLRKHPDELWTKLHEAALGVQYLHARNIVHGDLKGNNIVIGVDKNAKVTDFGLSLFTDDGVDPRISGASHWVAPECLIDENARPTYASDIYSLGMCIVEALRVVETKEDDTKACLPWGALGNFVAKWHAKHGELPPRPLCGPNSANSTAWRQIRIRAVSSLWNRLEQIKNAHNSTGLAGFYSIICKADKATKKFGRSNDKFGIIGGISSAVLRVATSVGQATQSKLSLNDRSRQHSGFRYPVN
ncbi:hypothetical protein ON010_g7141 [Phytophthora cinnamomi]|nr:hypothetical protein ON010_g7141 [Phytophthora cinnamomi]